MHYPGAIEDKKRHAKANQKALDNRLSQPKKAPDFHQVSSRSYIKSAQEVRTISDRLHRNNIRCKMAPTDLEKRHLNKTIQNIMEINDNFYQDFNRKPPSTSHGKKTLSDLWPSIQRLSKPKPRQTKDLVVDENGKVFRRGDEDDRFERLWFGVPHAEDNSCGSAFPETN